MKYSTHIAACILAINGPAIAQRHGGGGHHSWGHPVSPPAGASSAAAASTAAASVTPSPTSTAVVKSTDGNGGTPSPASGTASAISQASATNQASTTTQALSGGNGGDTGGGVFTISIVNSYSVALSLDFASNSGAPTPIGNPGPTTIGQAGTTAYSYPTGWAGRILVGKTLNSANSKIEGSVTGPPDQDVSYVDGYSVPIICTSAGKTSGCTIELFGNDGNYCGLSDQSLSDFEICPNPKVDNDDGTADSFFAPCAGQAYTFPTDDGANQGNVGATLNCCIGTACGGGSSKRDVATEKKRGIDVVSKREIELESHTHGRHEQRWSKPRSHVHRLVRDAKLKR